MTTPDLNPDEYFLLTAVRIDPVPMQFLADPGRGHDLNLPDPPDLLGEKLVDALAQLFERGDIIAQEMRWYHDDNGVACSNPIGDPFTPSRVQIERALRGDILLYYQFTQQGSARWEIAADVNWDNFIWDLWSLSPDGLEITATTRGAIEWYIARERNPFPKERQVPVPGTIRWETMTPWQATYWKTLPVGHRMTCDLQNIEVPSPADFALAVEHIQKWLAVERRAQADSWFRLPESGERLHPYIDQFRHPWRLYPPAGQSTRNTDHWHWRLSYRQIDFTHHVYWSSGDQMLHSKLYRYDPPAFAPQSVLKDDEKPLAHWEAVFEMREHFVRKSFDVGI